MLSFFVDVYLYSRSNPKSTAGRSELNWGLVQKLLFGLGKEGLFLNSVALTIILPPSL